MKKLIALLLAVLMVLSVAVVSFADSEEDDSSEKGGGGTEYYVPAAQKKAEAEQTAVEVVGAVDEDGNAVAVSLGQLADDATDEMKAEFEALAEKAAGVANGFAAVAASYPVTVTIQVPANFARLQADGADIPFTWNNDGTVTFTLAKACVMSFVLFDKLAA